MKYFLTFTWYLIVVIPSVLAMAVFIAALFTAEFYVAGLGSSVFAVLIVCMMVSFINALEAA